MFIAHISGKPTNFELLDKAISLTHGAAFTLTEKGWDGAGSYERRWTVWVPNHKVKYVEKVAAKSEYTIIVTCSNVNMGAGGIWQAWLSDVSSI